MAATVAVVQTSVQGVGVAVDITGTTAFQQVKLIAGPTGLTAPIHATSDEPASTAMALVVAVKPGVSVSVVNQPDVIVANQVNVSGTVTVNTAPTVAGASVTIQQGVSVSAQVSGTLTVNTAPTVAGASVTIQQGASVSVAAIPTVNTVVTVLSTVNVAIVAGAGGGGSVTTAAPSISATGQIAWIVGGQSTTVSPVYVSQINPPAGGGGSVTTAPPSISATGQLVFIVGGQGTTANPVVVTGTVAAGAGTTVVSIQGIVPVTTQASVSVSGLPVWMNPTQQVVVSGFQGQSVSAVVSGTISVLNVVPVTTAASVSVTGLPVWLNPTQQVVVSGFQGQSVSAVVSGTVNVATLATVNSVLTIVTQLGTQMVSIAQTSVSVAAIPTVNTVVTVLSTVNVAIVAGAGGGGSVTTAVPSISATGQVIWIAGGQSTTAFPIVVTGTVSAGAGTTVVSIQGIVPVTTQASVSVSGLPVWWNPDATVVVSGQVAAVTTQSSATGAAIWLAPTQTIVARESVANNVVIMVTSTAIAQSANFYLMTIWTGGTVAAAATTAWPVPAGLNFRALVLQAAMTTSAVVGGTVQFIVVAATATASMVSASFRTQGFKVIGQGIVTALPVQVGPMFAEADTPAATTIGIAIVASTACVLQNVIVQGKLY